jgi:hypothetical protein
MITVSSASAIQKMTFNFAKSNILYAISAPLPVLYTIDYIISNHAFIRKNKGHMLTHPKKIAKHLTEVAVSDIMNSDMMLYHIDERLHGNHDIVVHGIHAITFLMDLH